LLAAAAVAAVAAQTWRNFFDSCLTTKRKSKKKKNTSKKLEKLSAEVDGRKTQVKCARNCLCAKEKSMRLRRNCKIQCPQ